MRSHFRAHLRRQLRLAAALRSQRTGAEIGAFVVDLSLAGACVETDEGIAPGEQVTLALVTPTLWDPLIVSAAVSWATTPTVGQYGDVEVPARAGLVFQHATSASAYALMEVLAAHGGGFE